MTATLEANPSHLETVNTVTLGRARAKQRLDGRFRSFSLLFRPFRGDFEAQSLLRYYLGNTVESRSRVLPILFHGEPSKA